MYFDYRFIRKIFSTWENVSLEEIKKASTGEAEDSLFVRIKKLVHDFKDSGQLISKADLIILIRQLLMKQSSSGLESDLMVPEEGGWPTIEDWQCFSFEVIQNGSQYRIKPKGWRPCWLKGPSRKDDILLELLEDDYGHQSIEIPMEHFLKRSTGYQTYQNTAQRDALRSMFLMPYGSTLIVNIPTGSGKTLLAQAEFLKHTNRPDVPLSVVAVPTTSLAIDLERRTKEILRKTGRTHWLDHNFAFFGGMDGQEQVRNKIKKNIRSGTQGILFASPESIVNSFSPSLFDAVKSNNLSHFIVDEAHMICEWGDDFRCEYQLLPGLRRGLLKRCAKDHFRTILMSATLTPSNLSTLEELFGPKDDVQIISAVSLRSEPTYWSNFAGSKEEKIERLDETLRHVPRPFIVYMSKRSDVQDYCNHLKNVENYKRIAEFHGGTGAKDRDVIIKQWQDNKIDGIIANSAFGLGIDKSDVRSVVHGALPESLDRFYQEVGRGGRDGKPSASISIYSHEDIQTAFNLAEGSVIGTRRSFERWTTMWNKKKPFGTNLWALDYSIPPADLPRENSKNNGWNLKIINSLSRSSVIETDFEPIDLSLSSLFSGTDDEKQELRDNEWKTYRNSVFIRIKDEDHLDEKFFSHKLSSLWDSEEKEAKSSVDKLLGALRGDQEMGEVLGSLYTDLGRNIFVSRACRGCPGESDNTKRQNVCRPAIITPIERLEPTLCNTGKWSTHFGNNEITEIYLFYEQAQLSGGKIKELIEKLVKWYGVRYLLFSNEEFMNRFDEELLEQNFFEETLFFGHINLENRYIAKSLQMPTAYIYYPHTTNPLPSAMGNLNPFPIITIVPSDTKSHISNNRLLIDDAQNHASVGEFLRWPS
jgi:ATP-dependent DNA helicase RecQ